MAWMLWTDSMSYEQIELLQERIEKVPNHLTDRSAIRIRYVPDMAALGGEVYKVAKGAVAGGD